MIRMYSLYSSLDKTNFPLVLLVSESVTFVVMPKEASINNVRWSMIDGYGESGACVATFLCFGVLSRVVDSKFEGATVFWSEVLEFVS